MSELNAESSHEASSQVQEAIRIADKGTETASALSRAINDIIAGNEKIHRQVELSNQQLGNIVNVIREIDSKTKVINDIVFQTKLLSFNASVEAARAGEHGKGFAVVAEEVGNLARMSGKAAEEISTMLSVNVLNVERVIHETQNSVGKMIKENMVFVERGATEAKACGVAFSAMREQIRKVDELSSNIAIASKEQAIGVENISKSMDHLNQILTNNSRITQETFATSDDLGNQNHILNNLSHSLAWSVLGSRIRNKMDPETEAAIDSGLKAHAEWKSKLLRVFKGTSNETFKPETVCKDDQCALGKWIYEKGEKRFGKLSNFKHLISTHAEFHKTACSVLKKALHENATDHQSLIGPKSEFEEASSKVISDLAALKFQD